MNNALLKIIQAEPYNRQAALADWLSASDVSEARLQVAECLVEALRSDEAKEAPEDVAYYLLESIGSYLTGQMTVIGEDPLELKQIIPPGKENILQAEELSFLAKIGLSYAGDEEHPSALAEIAKMAMIADDEAVFDMLREAIATVYSIGLADPAATVYERGPEDMVIPISSLFESILLSAYYQIQYGGGVENHVAMRRAERLMDMLKNSGVNINAKDEMGNTVMDNFRSYLDESKIMEGSAEDQLLASQFIGMLSTRGAR